MRRCPGEPGRRTHFYLARKALIVRQAGADEVPSDTILRARARASFSGRRAEATAWLEGPSGQPVHRLEVEYSVLSEPVFARLFRQARVDMRHAPREGNSDESAKAARTNPYADPLPTTPIELGAEGARATIPSVAPLLCKGHFPLYPTLPVAIVMRALSDLAGAHLRASRGHASHTVLAAEVHAETLANAGQDVTFEARPDPAAQGVYQCTATAGAGRTVGTMRLTLASA